MVGIDPLSKRRRNGILIPRNTPLPVTAKRTFKTRKENQRSILVQIVEGEAEITIGGNAVHAREGTMVVMPANVPHALQAAKRFKMLLTMIRASQTSG